MTTKPEQALEHQKLKEQRLADAVADGWLEFNEDGKVVMSQKSKDKLRDSEEPGAI